MAIPVASYSEYAGSVINCDNILQQFVKAITKNHDPEDICTIASKLGGLVVGPEERFAVLQQFTSALKNLKPDQIPAEGLKLNDSEAANVTI
jgi:NADH-quinone oxidoreductase subunit G